MREFVNKNIAAFFFLSLLVFIAYVNSFHNAFVSDDIGAILQNKDIGNFSNVTKSPSTFIRPLFYFFAFKIGGLSPLVFRLINIFFHLGTTWVVFIIVSLMVNSSSALLTASLFAVHPILTESISWISGGPYSQYGFFLMIAFLCYMLGSRKKILYGISFLFFALALSSSEKAIIFPLILALYELSFSDIKTRWSRLISFFALSGLWVFLLFVRVGERITALQTTFYQEKGIDNPLIQIPVAITSYLQLIFFPNGLTLYHTEFSLTFFSYIIRLSIFILGVVGMIFSFKRHRMIFFWSSFFLISLLPTLTPFRISWIVAERYVYFGSVGIFVVVSLLFEWLRVNKSWRSLYYGIVFVMIASLLVRTIVRNIDWKNEDNLWIATGKTSPSSANNHNNLGDVYDRHGDYERAIGEFSKAIELKPNYADAYHNLGNVYRKTGKLDKALESYKKAIELNPALWQSYENIAAIYFEQNLLDLAAEHMEKAIKLMPQESRLYMNLGFVYTKMNNGAKAKEMFQKALELDPQNQFIRQIMEDLEKKNP